VCRRKHIHIYYLESLTVLSWSRYSPHFFKPDYVNTVFITARQSSLSSASSIQSKLSYPIYLRLILILSFLLRLDHPSCLSISGFSTQTSVHIAPLHMCRMPHLLNSSSIVHSNEMSSIQNNIRKPEKAGFWP
jgi:hypothetical protein